MARQNPALAREAQRREGMGPIYRRLLDRERDMQRRFGVVGQMRRPRYLLDALEAGETVTVPIWRVPLHLRPPRCGDALIVSPDM